MRGIFGSLTTRGRSFVAAGGAATVCGLAIPEPDLVRVGALLIILPLVSALIARRSRYRLACSRRLDPPRVPAGQPTVVTARLENVSRLPTGLLLAEDAVPYALGTRPRYVLNGIERGGSRELSYPLRSDLRGKFVVGPLEIRIADAFGLVELGRSFSSSTTFVVTPKVVALPRAVVAGSWLGDGDGRARSAAAAGEDDVVPRAYRNGDELRRVHWRSTARYGELMVRREEQRWRNRALLFLDTRRAAPADSRPVTATMSPLVPRMAPRPGVISRPRDGLITASELSSTSSKTPDVLSTPVSVTSCPSRPSRARCTPTEAAALTANSNDEATPVPEWPLRRVSRNSSARFRQRCSSRRTMSSPYRAVERQCTRRSSSPSR